MAQQSLKVQHYPGACATLWPCLLPLSVNIEIEIKGRHDPVIVPRAVVVVEAMTAITLLDGLLGSMTSRLDGILKFFRNSLD